MVSSGQFPKWVLKNLLGKTSKFLYSIEWSDHLRGHLLAGLSEQTLPNLMLSFFYNGIALYLSLKSLKLGS